MPRGSSYFEGPPCQADKADHYPGVRENTFEHWFHLDHSVISKLRDILMCPGLQIERKKCEGGGTDTELNFRVLHIKLVISF